jgi:hypothetical protein
MPQDPRLSQAATLVVDADFPEVGVSSSPNSPGDVSIVLTTVTTILTELLG